MTLSTPRFVIAALALCPAAGFAQLLPGQAVVVDPFPGRLSVVSSAGAIVTSVNTGADGAFDVDVTADGTAALVAHTSALMLKRFDLTTAPPTQTGSVVLPLAAQDVELTSTGFALITDGTVPTLVSVDIATMAIVQSLTLPGPAQSVAVTPDGTMAVVTGDGSTDAVRFVSISPTGTLALISSQPVPIGSNPTNVAISPNGVIALVANITSGSVGVYDLTSLTLVGSLNLGMGPGIQSIAFLPDGTRAYAYDSDSGVVAVLAIDPFNTVTDTGVRITGLGSTGGYYGVDHLAVSPDGAALYVRSFSGYRVVDTATATSSGLTPTPSGGSGGGIATSPGVPAPENEPPTIACGEPAVLWEPNHHLVDVSASLPTYGDSDTPHEDLLVEVRVVCDETEIPDTGDGTGKHAPDLKLVLADGSTGVFLRSERRGPSNGRVYMVILTVDDGEHSVTRVCTVAVTPHDQTPESLAAVLAEAQGRAAALQSDIELLGVAGVNIGSHGLSEHGLSGLLGPFQ